jgi:hypothetical protein
MSKPIQSSDTSCLETRLMSLLTDRINKELGKTRNLYDNAIYDIAWGTFALEYIGRHHERLYKELYKETSQIVSFLEQQSSEELEGLLYDYRRAVGITLSIYLLRPESLNLSKEYLDKVCEILIANSKSSEGGELIGATFLLLDHLKYKVLIDKIRVIMYNIRDMALREPELYLIELMYISFFSAIANDKFYIETLENIKRNEFLYEHIVDDPEKLTLFLYIVSKAIDYKNESLIEIEWCKAKRHEAASSLISILEENYSISSFVSALRNLKFSKGSDHIYEDIEYDLMMARMDLIAKMVLALYEAGYLKPFMLSKKEVDAYRQIHAELKNYRRVRKHELMFLSGVFILFMFLLPTILNSLFTDTIYFIQFILTYHVSYAIMLVIVSLLILSSIWSSGQINPRDIVIKVLSLIERFK